MWNTVDVPTTVDAVNQLEPGCYGFVLTECMDRMPPDLGDFLARYELIVHNTADCNQNGTLKLRCIDGAYNLMEYIGEILLKTEGTTIRWRRVATCMPPEVHELPLASDCIATEVCYYYRTQENICHVKFAVAHSSGTIPPSDFLVATLPEGFRPKENIWRPAFGLTNRTLADAFANAHIYTDGKIIIDGASVTIQSAWFDFDFVAQS